MSDLTPVPDDAAAPVRHAPELGLASAILGAVIFLAAPIVMILAAQIYAHASTGRRVAEARVWMARAGVWGPFLIALLGAWCGLRGMQRARREGGSIALPLAGLVLCLSALVEWSLATYVLLDTLEAMR